MSTIFVLQSGWLVEALMHEFPIIERGGQTIFPRADGKNPMVFLSGARGVYWVELAPDDDIASLRDKFTAAMGELAKA